MHRSWGESTGGGCVASIPLFQDEKVIAVLSIRRGSAQPFGEEDLEELRGLVEPYATGLEMVRVARRSLLQHALGSARSMIGGFLRPGSWGMKAVVAASLALCAWSVYGRISYSVSAPCELVPASSRQLAVASDGVLGAVLALPGDVVEEGELLCQFDTSELELEHARLRSELAILDVDRYRALSTGVPADVEMAEANSKSIRANLDLIQHRITAASVRATVDGVVLSGDHRNRIGDSLPKGTLLYEIAPAEGWKLEIHVPERDVGAVAVGLTGSFANHSRPEDSFDFLIERIAPSAESINGQNVFTVEAGCELPAGWARSGMEGFASIDTAERAPAWIVSHRALDFLRLHFWL